MYSFLVLGLIPGTNIQIGFWTWMVLMVGLIITFKIYKRRLYRAIENWWHKFDEETDVARKPLPASQLHRRLNQMAR